MLARYSLGKLIIELRSCEELAVAYLQLAAEVERSPADMPAQWWRDQARRSAFRPITNTMPGIDHIQLLCDEMDNGDGISAANVIKLRARVCRAKPCTIGEANALSLTEVADILDLVSAPTKPAPTPVAPESNAKRSTERDEGRVKLIAALTKHHQYADGSCLNLEPIGNNELAKAAGVSASTASTFFKEKFDGHTKYKALCRDSSKLIAALKLLNNKFAPHDLYGRRPAGEDDHDDD